MLRDRRLCLPRPDAGMERHLLLRRLSAPGRSGGSCTRRAPRTTKAGSPLCFSKPVPTSPHLARIRPAKCISRIAEGTIYRLEKAP